ncbi:MAG: phage repressor protein/antirepressor Ant [Anaerotignum sp.]|jgi:prophage antirepressor-like protein|nr:phage repressor protein/antirepressor Ant [Anaerotignum sp.]
MNGLQIFTYNGNEVRTVQKDGEPWWVLKDVCEVLGIGNSRMTYERLEEDEKGVSLIDTLGGKQQMQVINESGLYNVIIRSDKPEAKPFRKWITSEVLPSIRRHGAYMTPETLEAAILNPDLLIRLCTALKDEQDKNKALQAANSTLAVDNQIMKPKADYFDEIVDRSLLTNFRETAKQLQIKEKEFIRFLLDRKYIYRDKKGKIQPYADKNSGLFEVKEFVNEKTGFSSTQTLITPKGRETFRLLFLKAGA